MISGGAIQFFADKEKTVMKATASFDGGEVQCVNIHGVWVSRRAGVRWSEGLTGVRCLRTVSSMCESNLSGYLFLEMEVGSLFIPCCESDGYSVHGLDSMHYPGGESCREIGNQSGSILQLIVFCMDNVQLECVNIFVELSSRVDMGGGQPVHGFTGGIGVTIYFSLFLSCFHPASLGLIVTLSPHHLATSSPYHLITLSPSHPTALSLSSPCPCPCPCLVLIPSPISEYP